MDSFTKEEKKDYAKKNVRMETAKLFNLGREDIGLLPALVDYIETGNSAMFEEYNKFREMADAEKEAKEMEELTAKAQERYKEAENQYKQLEETFEDDKDKVLEAYREYRKFLENLREETEKEYPQSFRPNMRDIRDILQKVIDDTPQGCQKALFIKNGKKLCSFKAILYDGIRVILETGDETTILQPDTNSRMDNLYWSIPKYIDDPAPF